MPRYHCHRTTEINASPDTVYEAIVDFSNWPAWSPWLCQEPDAKLIFSDDTSSVGSHYSWEGEIVGQGEIEHKGLEPGKLIQDEIRFVKPFKSVSDVWFDLDAAGEGTRVTWHMRGSLPWFLFWMTSMMDTYIGLDYDRGLSMLKEWIETGEILSKTTVHGVQSIDPLRMAGIRRTCSMKDIGPSMEAAICEAKEKMQQHGLSTDGEPMTVYHKVDLKTQVFDFTTGFVLADSDTAPDELSSWSIPQSKALYVEHIGRYEHLGNPWSAAYQVARSRKLKQSKAGTFEIYRNNPQEVSPGELHTDIYMSLK